MYPKTLDPQTEEMISLVHDLCLVPRNHEAQDFYQIIECREIKKERDFLDAVAFSKRNRNRKYGLTNVLTPDYHYLGLFEIE